ncbi:hypothetical protein Patl1_08471 [Pistacia atlantica]|uniref:Uncharacterized protein n=1 Tax=Pistacia atlantica TaxID=434234 RepID=A0ACC1AH08_9ROSI|nr:hypothetical protein Patl1_08471 [Pistacia atlantica]
MGDYIGMESCLDLKNYEYLSGESREEENAGTRVQNYLRGKRDERWSMKKKEFPPPISLLARTENQPSHMPFVLKRYNTNDGRLVPLDDDVLPHPFADENEKEIDDQYCNAEEQQQEEETAALEIETEDSNAIGDFVHKVDNCYNNAEKEIIHKDAEETKG